MEWDCREISSQQFVGRMFFTCCKLPHKITNRIPHQDSSAAALKTQFLVYGGSTKDTLALNELVLVETSRQNKFSAKTLVTTSASAKQLPEARQKHAWCVIKSGSPATHTHSDQHQTSPQQDDDQQQQQAANEELKILMFGGRNAANAPLNDLWLLRIKPTGSAETPLACTWEKIEQTKCPSARSGHTMVCASTDTQKKVYVVLVS